MINECIKKYGLTKYLVENGATISTIGIKDKFLIGNSILQFNPGIAIYDSKLIISVRSVDYSIWMSYNKDVAIYNNDFQYNSNKDINSYLYIIETDKNDISSNRFQNINIDRPNNLTMYKGIEDCRLVVWDGELYASGTSREGDDDWNSRIHLCHLKKDDNEYFYEDSYDIIPADENDQPSCEKNWMPVNDQPFTWIKWTNPTTIAKYDINTKKTTTYVHDENKSFSSNFRGSSNVVKIGNDYYSIVHNVEIESDNTKFYKTYYSNIVKFDNDFNIIGCSDSFSFDPNFPIQFVCGMTYDGECLYISYSTDDSSSYVLKVDPKYIISLV